MNNINYRVHSRLMVDKIDCNSDDSVSRSPSSKPANIPSKKPSPSPSDASNGTQPGTLILSPLHTTRKIVSSSESTCINASGVSLSRLIE